MDANTLAFEALKALAGCKYAYASTVRDALAYAAHRLGAKPDAGTLARAEALVGEALGLLAAGRPA